MKAERRDRTENTYKKKILPLIQKNKGRINYLLLGHSYLERFKPNYDGHKSWTKYLEPIEAKTGYSIMNAGIGGDRLSNLLYLLEDKRMLDHLNPPSSIILVIGANEYFLDGLPIAEIFDGFQQVVSFIRTKFPTTVIHVIGFFPGKSNITTFAGKPFDYPQYEKDALLLRSFIIRSLANNETVFFHDWWHHFSDDKLYADDVHFNEAGYDIFGRLIKSIIDPDN